MQWRVNDALPPARISHPGGGGEVLIDARNVSPYRPPAHAPNRFAQFDELTLSDFKSWADVSALFAPLYQKAAILTPNSPLKAEVAKIRAASSDRKQQAGAALKLVQDQVRYFLIGMGEGGYLPAGADDTWTRRFGDCKGKTALLLALLHELGIEAEPALIATVHGDGLDGQLPNIGVFDHVLVRATIEGKTYWLDGTRTGDAALDRIKTPPFSWALPVRASGGALERLTQVPAAAPDAAYSLRLDGTKGLDGATPVHAEYVLSGAFGTLAHLGFASQPPSEQSVALKRYWNSFLENTDITSTSEHYDAATGEERLVMDGVAHPEWFGAGTVRSMRIDEVTLGGDPEFDREPGPHADAPYAVGFPYFRTSKVIIALPEGGKRFTILGGDIERTIANTEYVRHGAIANGVLTVSTSVRTLGPEFPAAEAPAAKTALKAMEKQYFLLVQNTKSANSAPTTALDFIARGVDRMDRRAYAEAVDDFNRAIALNPKEAIAYSDRALSEIGLNLFDAARADADKAAALDPNNAGAMVVRGALLLRAEKFTEAIAMLSKALSLWPQSDFAIGLRAQAYFHTAQYDLAQNDIASVLSLKPGRTDMKILAVRTEIARGNRAAAIAFIDKLDPQSDSDRLAQANLYEFAGEPAKGIAVLNGVLTANPKSLGALIGRANLQAKAGAPDRAAADYAAARELAKGNASALNELCWAQATHNVSLDLALGDCAAALKINPTNAAAIDSRAFVELRLGKLDDALTDYDAAVAMRPAQATSLYGRGLVKLRKGMTSAGNADLAAARAAYGDVDEQFKAFGLAP
jgi:tetratricopeptide (TPR) repeat protein